MPRFIDLAGQQFGELTVIKRLPNRYTESGNQKTIWECQCSCGQVIGINSESLRNGLSKSCGHNKEVDITCQRFGKLIALRKNGQDKWQRNMWLCLCDCGEYATITIGNLTSGNSTSCGCGHDGHPKHHDYKNRLYHIWQKMKERCLNANCEAYRDYGGRGIAVCKEWLDDYVNFKQWALCNGYEETLTIERIDVNGNYDPNNCMWANRKQQSNNKRNNIILKLDGRSQTLSEWSEETGISYSCLRARKVRGWDDYKTLTTPVRKNQTTQNN